MPVKTAKMVKVLTNLGFTDIEGMNGMVHKDTRLIVSLHKDKKEVPDIIYRANRITIDYWGICTSHEFDKLTGY